MTAHSKVQGNGPSVGLVSSSSKSSCLGLFAGDSITRVSRFTKCSQSWGTVAKLGHVQAFFILEVLKGPQVVTCILPATYSTWAVPASQALHAANFSYNCFTSESKGWATLCAHTTFLLSPRNGQNTTWDTSFCRLTCSVAWPCSRTADLSVLCSVSYLAHPFYKTAPSTHCSLKCRCQSPSGRASVSSVGNQKWKTRRQTNVINL